MKRRKILPVLLGVVTGLFVAVISLAANNLNSSKSNLYRVTYDQTVVTPAQATLSLKDLDTVGRVDEAKVREILRARGINAPNLIIRIVPAEQRRERIPLILLLKNPEDEPAAIAVSDAGSPADKNGKKPTK